MPRDRASPGVTVAVGPGRCRRGRGGSTGARARRDCPRPPAVSCPARSRASPYSSRHGCGSRTNVGQR
ncbi:hypothetical protein ABB07_08285 [Streptomyces incarnatus]|uniref:Uncharacterized protein n=1 Tax=Streptomyces incarnatus TaxID=665007 RepID=A0ABM5TGC9_9ACTN|nr:hypothetical protein ABB07_08285 [Streptomyces incarnatus]